jgi:hypothetical protein
MSIQPDSPQPSLTGRGGDTRALVRQRKTPTGTHAPTAASKAQVGVLYCPSFHALKAYNY